MKTHFKDIVIDKMLQDCSYAITLQRHASSHETGTEQSVLPALSRHFRSTLQAELKSAAGVFFGFFLEENRVWTMECVSIECFPEAGCANQLGESRR